MNVNRAVGLPINSVLTVTYVASRSDVFCPLMNAAWSSLSHYTRDNGESHSQGSREARLAKRPSPRKCFALCPRYPVLGCEPVNGRGRGGEQRTNGAAVGCGTMADGDVAFEASVAAGIDAAMLSKAASAIPPSFWKSSRPSAATCEAMAASNRPEESCERILFVQRKKAR